MPDAITEFIKAACVPRQGSHASGTLQEAERIRAGSPEIETANSFWTERRTPDSVLALLEAGASMKGVPYPSGYDAVDALLKRYGAE